METKLVPFRLSAERRAMQLNQFNVRNEIVWFGFEGGFEEPGIATITFKMFNEGLLGGGGTRAINGGVISAGFDAAFVLAGLGQYDVGGRHGRLAWSGPTDGREWDPRIADSRSSPNRQSD